MCGLDVTCGTGGRAYSARRREPPLAVHLATGFRLRRVRIHVEIDDQGQVIGGVACQFRVDDPGVTDLQRPADEGLVERGDRPVGRERAEPPSWRCHLHEAMFREGTFCQGVEPVVEVLADDHRRQMGRLVEEAVFEQVPGLPVPFAFGQAQVPVHQVNGALRRLDDRHLGTSRLSFLATQRDLVMGLERPSREDEVAIPATLEPNVELIEVRRRLEGLCQLPRLVVVPRPRHVAVHFLEADDVRVLLLDDPDDPLEAVSAIPPAYSLMDVIAQHSHQLITL